MNEYVDDLAPALIEWMRRRRQVVDWVYHPRKTDVSDYVRRKVLGDLLSSCTMFHEQARRGEIACDLNVSLSKAQGRTRKLDLVVGAALNGALPEAIDEDVLRKAKVGTPRLALETKLCMTEHRKATSRLIDELLSSLDVVRGVSPDALCVAVVVVNVAARFTSPLNLPGPNLHERPVEIHRLVEKVLTRVGVGDSGYDALAIALVDVDNEHRFEVGVGIEIPQQHLYPNAIQAVARRWTSPPLTN
ncbi:MAG: hypothetical protein ABUL62_06875 [Myxococcales bacterium]